MLILKNDKYLSKVMKDKFFDSIKPKQCYNNIFNIAYGLTDIDNLEVGFGYWGIPSRIMTRHAFFVLNGTKIIDPTLADYNNLNTIYHVFKTYSINEYRILWAKIINEIPIDKVYSSLLGLIPEERNYCKYVIENNIPIDDYSYYTFLEIYDKNREVIIASIFKRCS